jgi:hypothetical protein
MLPPIIGLLGRSRCGKDTFARVLCQETRDCYVVRRLAAPVKEAAAALYGFTQEQLEGPSKELTHPCWNIRPRDAMIRITHDTMGFMGPDFFTRRFWTSYDGSRIIIPDVRYEHDLAWIRERGGIVIKITRPTYALAHEAEAHIDALIGDTEIVNCGSLLEFEEKVRVWTYEQ